jgi:hypothetical protein
MGLVRVPVHEAWSDIVPFPVTAAVPELVQEEPADDVEDVQFRELVVEGMLAGAPTAIPQEIVAPGLSSTTTCRFWMIEQLGGITLKAHACIV